MIVLIPLLAAIAGALIYALASNPKLAELGRLAYAAGVLATLLVLAQHSVRLFPA